MTARLLQPKILETKQELLEALKTGQIKTSKYNLLSHNEKIYVELVVFGGYTGEQAVRVIDPTIKNPLAISNRICSSPDVAATLEELSVAKDKKFMAEISSVRDMALAKLKYIMCTSVDEALQATCAKVILDKSEAIMKNVKQDDEPVSRVSFNIQVENMYAPGVSPTEDQVIIPIDDEECKSATEELNQVKKELQSSKQKLKQTKAELAGRSDVNPSTGLPYTISYEGIDNYSTNPEEMKNSTANFVRIDKDEDW